MTDEELRALIQTEASKVFKLAQGVGGLVTSAAETKQEELEARMLRNPEKYSWALMWAPLATLVLGLVIGVLMGRGAI